MQSCWKVTFMRMMMVMMLMVMVLMVVVTKADTITTITTQKPFRQVQKKCLENLDGSEMKICATNGTDFVKFPNECRLKEANQEKGITAFKKVALSSCASSVSKSKSTKDRSVVKPSNQTKILNNQQPTTTDSMLRFVYNAKTMTRRFQRVKKTISAKTRLKSGLVDKTTPAYQKHVNKITTNITPIDTNKTIHPIKSTSSVNEETTLKNIRPIFLNVNEAKSTTFRPSNGGKIASITTTPSIASPDETTTTTRSVVLPVDKDVTSVIRINSVTPLDKVTSPNMHPKISAKNDVKPTTNYDINKMASVESTVRLIVDKIINEKPTMEKVLPAKSDTKEKKINTSTTIRPTVTTMDEVISTTIRPILTPVSEVEPSSIHPENTNTKEEAVIVPNIKPMKEIITKISKIGTNTIHPMVHKVETNFSPLKDSTVITDPKVSPVYPETSANIPPLAVQMEAQKSNSCPYAFNPVCATHGGVNSTFLNKCLLNAEKDKTGKDWTIIREGTCDKEQNENINHQHKDSTEGRNHNITEKYENSPTVLELGGDNIVFAPIIERTEYEDGRIVEHSYPSNQNPTMTNAEPHNTQFFPSYGTPETTNFKQNNDQIFPSYEAKTVSNFMPNNGHFYSSYEAPAMINFENSKQSHGNPTITNFAPNTEQSYPLYGSSAMSNFEPNNDIFYPSNVAPAMTNLRQGTEQSYPADKDTTMMSFEKTQYNNPLFNSQPHFVSRTPPEATFPISYPISDNDIGELILNMPQVKALIRKRHAKNSRQRKHLPCTKRYNPVCAMFSGVKSTFNNECLVNAENIKTNSAWTIISRDVCAEEYANTSNRNNLRAISTRSNHENLYEAPQAIEQEYGADIIYVPPIFQTEIIEDPHDAQNYDPSSEQTIFKNSNEYSPPLPVQTNYEPVQSQRSEGHAPALFATNSYSPLLPQENNLEDLSQYAPDIPNSNKASVEAGSPPQDESNNAPFELPNFSGTEQNAAPMSIVASYETAPQYEYSINNLRAISARSNNEKMYKASQAIEQEYGPEIIYVPPVFQTEIIEDDVAQNYDSSPEQKVFKNSNDYSPHLLGQTNSDSVKLYGAFSFDQTNFGNSNKNNEHIPAVEFERADASFLQTNSYAPLSPEQNKFEGSSQLAPDVPNAYKVYTAASAEAKEPLQEESKYTPSELPNFSGSEQNLEPLSIITNFEGVPQYAHPVPTFSNYELSAQDDSSFSNVDFSTKYAPPLENLNTETPNKYASRSSSEVIEPDCLSSGKKKTIRAVYNVPINKASICNLGAAHIPICGSYKNERHSFRNICELMLRNIDWNETWAPIYEGRCRCPEVCTSGTEPICVSKNGVMETISDMCYYERLKIQDPFSSWQYHFKGECFERSSNPDFRHSSKPIGPLNIKVPDYEKINIDFPNSKELLYPSTVSNKDQELSSPILKYPREIRGYGESKTLSTAVFKKKSSSANMVVSKESTPSIISSSSNSTKAPETTATIDENIATSTHPYDKIATTTATKAPAKLIPYKKSTASFVVSAKKPKRASIYSSNPNSAIMRLAKSKAFAAVNSKSARIYRQNADHS